MTRPHMDHIEMPSLPEGIETRPLTGADLPRLLDALSEAFHDRFDGSSEWHKPLNT